MLVRLELFRSNILKFGEEGTQLSFRRPIIQALEIVRDLVRARTLREPYSLVLAHQAYNPALAFVGKEVIQTHPEDHGDAQECGQSGKQLSPFELGEQGCGKARMLAEFDQAHAFAEAEGAQFFTDGIAA